MDRYEAIEYLIKLADALDEVGEYEKADQIDKDFQEFLELLEKGELTFDYTYSLGPRDPRQPYSNPGRGPMPTVGVGKTIK